MSTVAQFLEELQKNNIPLDEPFWLYQGKTPREFLATFGVTPEQTTANIPDPQQGSLFDDLDWMAPVAAFAGPALMSNFFPAASSASGFGFGSPESLIGAETGSLNAGPIYGGGGVGEDGMDFWEQFTPDWFDTGDAITNGYWTDVSTPFNWEQFTPSWMDSSSTYWPEGVASSAPVGMLSKLASALGTSEGNLSKLLGAAIPAALGAFGANQQSNALSKIAEQQDARWKEMVGMGAPYRSRLEGLYANPQSFLSSPEVQGPVQQGTDALARSLSAKVGNPIGNPGALGEIQNYATNSLYNRLGQEKDRLAGYGGLSAYNQAGAGGANNSLQAQMGSLTADKGIYDAIGYGIGNYLNPPSTLESLLKSINGGGIFQVK